MNNMIRGAFDRCTMGMGRRRLFAGKVVSIASSPNYRPSARMLPGNLGSAIWPKDNWLDVTAADNLEEERHALELIIDMFETKNIQCALVGGASPLLHAAFAQETGCDDGPQMAS